MEFINKHLVTLINALWLFVVFVGIIAIVILGFVVLSPWYFVFLTFITVIMAITNISQLV